MQQNARADESTWNITGQHTYGTLLSNFEQKENDTSKRKKGKNGRKNVFLYFRDASRTSSHNFYAHFLPMLLIRLILRSRDNLNHKKTLTIASKKRLRKNVVSFSLFITRTYRIFCCRYRYAMESIRLCGANNSS